MRIEFNWQGGGRSILQRDDSAQSILVDGEQVWPRLPQDEQRAVVPFPIGTRVQCTNDRMVIGGPPVNQFGRVVHLDSETNIGVEWEDWNGGHDCEGHATRNRGWYVMAADLVAAPLSQTTTPTSPDCETPCGNCRVWLGACERWEEYQREENIHDYCLDNMVNVGGVFYHEDCAPEEEEEETPPPAFQVGDEVTITRGRGRLEVGHVGTIRLIDAPNLYGVEIPGIGGGTYLGGILSEPYGWYCTSDILERR